MMPYHSDNRCQFNPEAVFDAVCCAIEKAIKSSPFPEECIKGLSITGQRATIVPLDGNMAPSGSGVTWQDVTCERASRSFYASLNDDQFITCTGLPEGTLWTISKIAGWKSGCYNWNRDSYYFALLHDYLLLKFGAPGLYTDHSNASVTGLYDIQKGCWSGEILEALELHEDQLPVIASAGTSIGMISSDASKKSCLPAGTPLFVGAGDQQCATLGGGGISPGDDILCLGAAGILNCRVSKPVTGSTQGVFCTAHALGGLWVMESIHNSFGTSGDWAADILGLKDRDSLSEIGKSASAGSSGLLFLPFLAGIGSPDFDASARGAFVGLSMNHCRAEIANAVLEGVALEMRRILDSVAPCRTGNIIKIVGGRSRQHQTIQTLADITGQELLILNTGETTILGLAALLWTGLGVYSNITKAMVKMAAQIEARIVPNSTLAFESVYRRYLKCVRLIRDVPPFEGRE